MNRAGMCYKQVLVHLYGLGSLLYALGLIQNGVYHSGTPLVHYCTPLDEVRVLRSARKYRRLNSYFISVLLVRLLYVLEYKRVSLATKKCLGFECLAENQQKYKEHCIF